MLIIDFLIKRAQHSVLKDNNDRKPFRLMPFVANHVTCDEQRELGLANIYVMVNWRTLNQQHACCPQGISAVLLIQSLECILSFYAILNSTLKHVCLSPTQTFC